MIVDKLCEIFDKIRLPDTATLNGTHPHSTNLFDLAKVKKERTELLLGTIFFLQNYFDCNYEKKKN